MVGGGVSLAGGGFRDSVSSNITVVVVGGIPRVGVGVTACLVASKCSGIQNYVRHTTSDKLDYSMH